MAYDTEQILTDAKGRPIGQVYWLRRGRYDALDGEEGALEAALAEEDRLLLERVAQGGTAEETHALIDGTEAHTGLNAHAIRLVEDSEFAVFDATDCTVPTGYVWPKGTHISSAAGITAFTLVSGAVEVYEGEPLGVSWGHGTAAATGHGFTAVEWTPAEVGGLGLWLDHEVGVYQNSDGTTEASAGDPVGYWEDQSGNGNHATQSTTSKKPTLKSDGVEGDGSDDEMALPDSLSSFPTSTFTIYVAVTPGALANTKAILGVAGTDDFIIYPNSSGGNANGLRVFWRDMGRQVIEDTSGDQVGIKQIITIIWTGSTITAYRGRTEIGSNSLSGDEGPFSSISLFAWDQIQRSDARLHEPLLYSTAHSSGERSEVWDYLEGRHGL